MDISSYSDTFGLDIAPMILKEWSELSKGLSEALRAYLYDDKDSNYNIPAGYSIHPDDPKLCKPIPNQLCLILNCLDRCRFTMNLTVREAHKVLLAGGVSIGSHQAVINLFDRAEDALDLFPSLPEGVIPKNAKHKLELKRKKREAMRLAKQQRETRIQKDKLQKEIDRVQRKIVEAARQTQMTSVEVEFSGANLDNKLEQLKDSAKSSRFDADLVIEQEEIDPSAIIFKPHPKQAEFLAASEKVVFYGGAAGGGKSYALLIDGVRFAHRAAMRALIIRRSIPQLKELISVSNQLYKKAFPGAKYNKQDRIWTFPAGGTLEFGYCDAPDDVDNYIGLPYSYIGWDEIQMQKSPEAYDFLFSRLRSTDPEITCYIRCTGNPGGAPWVKQRFIDPAPYNTPFLRATQGQEAYAVSHRFIPATLFDNPSLTADGEYEKVLRNMAPVKVQQLLFGNWDIVDDSFFQWDDSLHINDNEPEFSWPIIHSADYGWNDPASSLWAKINPNNGALYVYRESEFINKTVAQWGAKLREAEANEYYCKVTDRVIDPSLFKQTGHTGPSHLETLNQLKLRFRPADRNREAGWEQINQRLLPNLRDGNPMIYVHSDCKRLIDQLRTAIPKEGNPNDICDKRMFSLGRKHHWDLLDCLRYMCMARPRTDIGDKIRQAAKATSSWQKYNNYFTG